MASSAAVAGTRSGFQALAQIEAKSTSPYGLPIVDNCSECKLRGTDFFCCLSAPALAALDEIKHTTSYPEGALVFMEGQAARGATSSAKVPRSYPRQVQTARLLF
jgi:hypothetical protein